MDSTVEAAHVTKHRIVVAESELPTNSRAAVGLLECHEIRSRNGKRGSVRLSPNLAQKVLGGRSTDSDSVRAIRGDEPSARS